MADGTIKIDIDIPVNKVKSDSHAVNEELERIGKNAGKDMDSSFKKNADSVKREAKSTGESIDKSIGREHKIKIKVDSSEAKTKINETKHDLDEIPKKHETKVDADASQFNRKVDEAKRKTNELPKKHNTDIDATDHTGGVFARIKSHFDGINERGEKTHSLFRTIFSANLISNAVTGAFGHVKDAIGGMIGEAKQYALEQQTMNATWLTLTNSASKGRAMVNQINQMAVAAQNSTKMVDELSQKFYAINNNAKQTGQLTKSILTLQDAFGQTDAAVENFGTQFSQMMANGKVSAQDMMSIVNTFPKLRPMLLDYERRIHHSSNMTMAEMNKMMSDGKIKSQDMINVVLEAGKKFNKATGNFTATIPGMVRVVQSQMPTLLSAFTTPWTKLENPILKQVTNWISSSKTKNAFSKLGKTMANGVNKVINAFMGKPTEKYNKRKLGAKSGKLPGNNLAGLSGKTRIRAGAMSGNLPTSDVDKSLQRQRTVADALNGVLKKLNGTITSIFNYIAKHAQDLKDIAKDLISITGQIGKSVWHSFVEIAVNIGKAFGLIGKNAEKHGGAVHALAQGLNNLAKSKGAIQTISKAIVAIAVIKGLDRIGGSLWSIGEKGYHAYRNTRMLIKGMKGVENIKDLSKTEKAFFNLGKGTRKVFSTISGGLKKMKGPLKTFAKTIKGLGKGAWEGLKTATETFAKSFAQQIKIIGHGVKSLGKGIWNAAKAAGSQVLKAGKFLGSEISKGFKASAKFTKGLFSPKAGGAGKLTGLLQSAHSAGGFKTLTTAGKIGAGLAGAGVALDAGSEFVNAYKDRHNAGKRSEDIGKGIGAGIGGGIGLWFGGPAGAAIGAQIGKFVGGWGGKAVNNFTKGWQRHKPPKNFWSLENLGYSAHNMWNGFTKSVSNTVKWFKKNWKEIGVYFVNPIAGAINSLYKHNKGFHKWVDNLVKGFKKAWKGIGKWFSNIGKGIQKSWKSMTKFFSNLGKNMAKGIKSAWKGITKWFGNLGKGMAKGIKSAWHGVTKWFGNIAKGVRNAWHSMTSWFSRLGRNMSRGLKATWHNVVKFFGGVVKGVKGVWHGITGWFGKLGSNAVKGFKSAWNGVKSWFKGIIDGIKSAWDGFWDKVSGPFKFLGKVFSGKAKIGSIHFANGTDWQTRWGVPAILNDGNDSPQTNNRESLIYPDGTWELLPNKRNLKRILPFGTDVVNARDTANLASRFVHYADGTLDLEDLNVSKSQENVLKKLLRISSKQLQVVVEEARRKRDRDRKQAQRQKSKDHKSKKSKPLKITIDNKKRKGSVLVDKGLLTGSLKGTGHETWINEKLFKKLMSYTKAKPIKVSKNSRIRYRAIPTRRNSKGQYLVDSKWLTGAKKNTGKLEALTKDAYLKLLQFTKAERKYKLPKKKRKASSSRRRTTTRRSSSGYSSRSYPTRRYSTRSYSSGGYSRSGASVAASVSGLKSIQALSKALKGLKGTHKVKVKASASGSKSITKLAKSIKKVAGKHKVKLQLTGTKTVSKLSKNLKTLTSRVKSSRSALSKIRTSAKHASSGLKSLGSRSSSTAKRIKALYKTTKKSKFGSAIAKQAEKAVKSLEGKGNFAKAFKKLANETKKTLSKMKSETEKTFKTMWNNLKKDSSNSEGKINSDLGKFGSKFRHQWSSIESGVHSAFARFWSSMKRTARDGLNDVLGVLNQAIGKIDTVVNQFGGSKNAVHKVARLATGTGALGGVRRPITAPTLAILNDGYDSPETGNQEAIWDRNTGNVEVVPGRFTPRILKPGQEVFNATETKILGYTTPQHFASGTGALKQLYEIAKHNWEHPQKTGQALFSAVTGLTGAINQLAQGARKKGENQGVKWWSQLWKMVEDKVDDDLGPASGLLKAVEEIGRGKHYLWGGYGLDSKGLDCSGLVSTALEHYYHSGWGHLDVGGLWQHAHRIPKSEAKPGDPVFWLPDEHVGVYAGHGMYYSAYGPNDGGPIGMQPVGSGATFGRFNGINTEGSKNAKEAVKVKANNRLQKQIKNQVGQGFWKTIQKIADKYGEQFNGANSISGSMIEAAARKMHVHLPDGFVKDVLRVAMSESGNRNIQQQIHDVNSGGNEAQGPLQFTPQTFKAFAMPGHTNIHNPYDELLAFFNNSDWRNSIGWTTIWGHRKFDWLHSGPIGHRRFAIGGILNKPETIDVAEAGHPESIIPWDPAYRGRALAIMQATLDHFMAQDGKSQRYQSQAQQAVDLSKTNAEIEAINEKFDAALAQLGILTNKNEVIQLTNTLDKRVIGEAMYTVTKNKLQRDVRNEAYRISGHY